MTDARRWEIIEDALPMLRGICKATLERANCVTMSIEELLSELLPQCYQWLAEFDPAINPNPNALLSVSARLKARTIVQQSISANGSRITLDDLTSEQQPEYTIAEQIETIDVLNKIGRLPTMQAFIASAIMEGKTQREIARELGLSNTSLVRQWEKMKSNLAIMLKNPNARQ